MIDDLELLNEEDAQEGKFLTFPIGNEEYAIGIRHIMEIMGIQKITDLPDMENYVKGVINLRGKVIPIVDVRLRFGLPEKPYDDRTCIIVTQMKENYVGLIVDSVKEVLDIPASQIEPPPTVRKGAQSRFVQGLGKVGEDVKIILDMSRLLYDEELDTLSAALT
jgi:purine-binding chemotaxis protein CheW